jgi:hypothetical protein
MGGREGRNRTKIRTEGDQRGYAGKINFVLLELLDNLLIIPI